MVLLYTARRSTPRQTRNTGIPTNNSSAIALGAHTSIVLVLGGDCCLVVLGITHEGAILRIFFCKCPHSIRFDPLKEKQIRVSNITLASAWQVGRCGAAVDHAARYRASFPVVLTGTSF